MGRYFAPSLLLATALFMTLTSGGYWAGFVMGTTLCYITLLVTDKVMR